MRPRRIALVALAIGLAAPPAEAAGRRRRCVEDAAVPVIGRARCHRFGRWDVTTPVVDNAISTTLELGWHRLLLTPRTFDAALTVNQVTSYGVIAGAALGQSSMDIATGRFALEIARLGPVRFGPAFEAGGATFAAAPSFAYQGKSYAPTSLFYGAFGADASMAIAAGPLFLRGGAFVGFQGEMISTTEATAIAGRPHAYWSPPPGGHGPPQDGLVLNDERLRLAPRVSVEVWLDDHWTFGVAGSMDAIHQDDFALSAFFRSYLDRRGQRDPRVE